ncbi:hypothetical protein ACMW84_01495 [Thermoanaerobacter mathranii]
MWECLVCDAVHDRDGNAVANLRNYGAACVKEQ